MNIVFQASPEKPLPFLSKGLAKVYIKRDDMIHPFISGNKIRKLKYWLGEGIGIDKKSILTFGGAFSNHLLATAAAAASLGIPSIGIVRGEESREDNTVLFLCKRFGMKLVRISREEYSDDKEALHHSFKKKYPEALIIPEGGFGRKGMLGLADEINELAQKYDFIFTAMGTGTTAAGLANGVHQAQINTSIQGVSVLKNYDFEPALKELISPAERKHLNILHDYPFGGYAKTTPELLSFMDEFSSQTGILLDPVYTAKVAFAIKSEVEKSLHLEPCKILFLHTGGTTGLLGMQERF